MYMYTFIKYLKQTKTKTKNAGAISLMSTEPFSPKDFTFISCPIYYPTFNGICNRKVVFLLT